MNGPRQRKRCATGAGCRHSYVVHPVGSAGFSERERNGRGKLRTESGHTTRIAVGRKWIARAWAGRRRAAAG